MSGFAGEHLELRPREGDLAGDHSSLGMFFLNSASHKIVIESMASMGDLQEPIDWRYRFHIFLAYFSGLCLREYPHNSYGQTYGTLTYLHLLDPEDLPLIASTSPVVDDRVK